jgi:hypothetical protein
MITVKHPLEQYNTAQENFISNISDQDKEYHSLLFSYGNASYLYHHLPIESTFEDYTEWLEGLNENMRKDMQTKGFEACKNILSFTRYVREKRDIGMEDFVIERMGTEEYSKFKELF